MIEHPHQPSATMKQDEVKIPYGLPLSDISRIQKNFRIVTLRGDQLACRFYELLFLKYPELQMFFSETNVSQQHGAFLNGLGTLVLHLEHPQKLRADLVKLGQRHQAYGISLNHYPPVVNALLQALTELAEEGMDGKTHLAWANFLHLVRAIMLENSLTKVRSEASAEESHNIIISDNSNRILLIDDDQSLLDLYHSFLETQGYICSQVSDVPWAFTHLQMSHYDLVLTDFQMPEMNGIQIKKKLDYLGNGIFPPFVLITGKPSPEIRTRALEAGFVAVLKKPCNLKKLDSLIRVALKDPGYSFQLINESEN